MKVLRKIVTAGDHELNQDAAGVLYETVVDKDGHN